MLRNTRFLLLSMTLTLSSNLAQAELPIPENPRWKPIADEVYLQEVGAKIETETPLLSVAVNDGAAFVGHKDGVSRVDGEKLTSMNGPKTKVTRLRVLDKALWAIAEDGLWRFDVKNWEEVASGSFVDLCLHNGGIVVVSERRLFSLEDGKLEVIDGSQSPQPILGVTSYSETLYVRHADSVAFLSKGRFNYDDVNDWGHLPRNSQTRDMLTIGSRVLVPTDKGLSVLRGMTWSTLTGEEGLCYEDTTCVAEGFDRDYWVGTNRGAIRAVGDEFQYFGYDRWIPDERVNAIACGDNVTYIATDGGLGIISYEPYTLQKKSKYYKRWINEWGMRRLGFINELILRDDGTYIRYLSDNDGGWTCHYLDALCYEYAVTRDPEVKAEAIDTFRTIKWCEEICPMVGFPARAIYAVGEEAIKTEGGSAGRAAEWNLTEDGKWEWKGDTSSDEVASHYYTLFIFYELVAKEDEAVEAAAVEHIQRITDHIIDNGWVLRDYDGKPTVWARWDRDFIFDHEHHDEYALNSAQAMNIIEIARHMVGGEKYDQAKQQLIEWGYPEMTLRTKIVFPGYTHFDDRLAFLGYYPLLTYESDPKLRPWYMRSLQRSWEAKRFENQTWFHYIYGALTGNEMRSEAAIDHLRQYPLDCRDYAFTNSHRDDLQVPEGFRNYVTDTKAMGPREQGIRRWDRDPLQLDGGGSHGILDPSSYLDAYWMGRYYGMILAPETDDPELLTVEKRNLQLGAKPYDGPPRPDLGF
ncbi:MAG: hypothetical protein KC944_14795 [Candidatus Omnitrophica bacterium]|nr:hypothetical protein [Candidatus Omnitrophota bacterium]